MKDINRNDLVDWNLLFHKDRFSTRIIEETTIRVFRIKKSMTTFDGIDTQFNKLELFKP
jgi:hypothetical protein